MDSPAILAAANAHNDVQSALAVISAVASAANAYLLLLVKVEIGKAKSELIDRIHQESTESQKRYADKNLENRVYNLEQRKC